MSGSVIIDLNIIADVLEFFCNETQNNLGGITMRQIGTQSAKYFRRFVTAMLVFAMVITSLTVSSVDSQAAKKVKKVTIGVKVGGSGILVLKKGQSKKLKVSVTPKKASKKVTYKSSKASIVSVSSKGVVKARKSKGSAKITVTSKQNAKKKATIKVKIGTPVKKVAISKNATSTWSSANYKIVEKNGQKTKVYPKYTDKLKAVKNTFTIMNGRNMVIKASVSPKKATRKSLKWSTNKGSILKVVGNGTKATVIARKIGKANVIARATDGSGKKAVVKVNVVKFKSDKTPAPTATPDTRKKTLVENFESYPVGTEWKYTSADKNSGTMKVVQDPEDASNKCLEVDLNGTEAAYDFAPIFNIDLSKLKDTTGKTMGSFSGASADLRVVSTSSDVTYKAIYVYLDQYGKMNKKDKFAADTNKSASAHVNNKGEKVAAGAADEDTTLRFGINNPMGTGTKADYGVKLFNGNESKENGAYFPGYHDNTWKPAEANTHYAKDSCTTGFKEKEADGKVGFANRSVSFDTTYINDLDATLANQTKFDLVWGTTYQGNPTDATNKMHTTWYIDNLSLIEEDIPVTDFKISLEESKDVTTGRVANGGNAQIYTTYTPANTTQKGLTWTTTNDKVTVNASGKVSVADDFVFPAGQSEVKVTVTATSKYKAALSKSIELTVYKAAEAQDITISGKELAGMLVKDWSDAEVETALVESGSGENKEMVEVMDMRFTKNNLRNFFKLPENIDLSQYERIVVTGNAWGQMNFDTWDAGFTHDTENDSEWYKKSSVSSYPFFEGAHPYRPQREDIKVEDFLKKYPEIDKATYIDGNTNIKDGVIPKGTTIGPRGVEPCEIDIEDDMQNDYSNTGYVSLGTNKPLVEWDETDDDGNITAEFHYYIYSIKFVTKKTAKAEEAAK